MNLTLSATTYILTLTATERSDLGQALWEAKETLYSQNHNWCSNNRALDNFFQALSEAAR
jgi:hypothetical protein